MGRSKIFPKDMLYQEGLNPDNVDKIYLRLYSQWRFVNSDKVWINGKLLSKEAKEDIKIALRHRINPTWDIEVSDMQGNFPLTEKMFVEDQLDKNQIPNDRRNEYYLMNTVVQRNRVKIYLNFLNKKLKEFETDRELEPDKPEMENLYPEIFKDVKAFKLFETLHKIYKDSKTELADYSFIYRMMYKDGYILPYQKPEMFREWLCKEPFCICLDNKFKALDRCKTKDKLNTYNIATKLIPQ